MKFNKDLLKKTYNNILIYKSFIIMGLLVSLSMYSLIFTMNIQISVSTYEYKINKDDYRLNEHTLNMSGTYDNCKDIYGMHYTPRVSINLENKKNIYTYTCSGYGNEYNWEITKVKVKLIDPTILSYDIGCKDSLDNIFPIGYTIKTNNTFTCKFKNNTYYWLTEV